MALRADHRFFESVLPLSLCLPAIPDGEPASTAPGMALGQRFLEQGRQPLPMPVRSALVIGAVVGYRPAMTHPDIVFDRVIDLGAAQSFSEAGRLLGREATVDPGNADIDPGPDLGGILMGAVGRVAGQIAAVKARRGA